MQEIELKFQVPAARMAAVEAALLALPGADTHPLAMHAAYVDTPDSRLAQQKMALRVRREGTEWVQTFKAGGTDAMTRLEDNQALPAAGPVFRDGRPVADLSLHIDAGVQAALTRALGSDEAARDTLGVVYETVFERHTAVVQNEHGSVQLCLDRGAVRAGALEEPLAELEFELLTGHPRAVIDAARQWVDTHALWLDVQSKAYRGTRLALAARGDGVVRCRPVALIDLPGWPTRSGGAPTPGDAASPAGAAASTAEMSACLAAALNATLDAAAGNLSEVAWLRPGWAQAAQGWLSALARWHSWAAGHPLLSASVPPEGWTRSTRLLEKLVRPQRDGRPAAPSAEQRTDLADEACHASAAQAIAQGGIATHWALDMLQAIAATRA